MGAGKAGFYGDLRQEYLVRREDSVLFRFLAREGGRDTGASRLRRCRDAFRQGETSAEGYARELLGILRRRKQLYQSGYETGTSDWVSPAHLLAPLVCGALGKELPERLNRNRLQRELEALCALLEGDDPETLARLGDTLRGDALRKGLLALCPGVEARYQRALLRLARDLRDGTGCLDELAREALACAVHQEVKQFLYDRGAALEDPSEPRGRRPGGRGAGPRVKTGKTLGLLEAWTARYGGWPAAGRGAAPQAATAEQCEAVYRLLLDSRREDVLFPLRVDPATGCALYIVGKAYYRQWYRAIPDPLQREQKLRALDRCPRCCCYAILSLDREGGSGRRLGFLLDDTGYNYYHAGAATALEGFQLLCEDAADQLRRTLRGLPEEAFAPFPLPPEDGGPARLDEGASQRAAREERELREAMRRAAADAAARAGKRPPVWRW